MKPNFFPTVSVADLASLSCMATGEGRRGRGRKAACAHATKIGGEIAGSRREGELRQDIGGIFRRIGAGGGTEGFAPCARTSSPPLPCASRLRSRRLISPSSPMSRPSVAYTVEHGGEGAYHIVVITDPGTQPIEIRLGRGIGRATLLMRRSRQRPRPPSSRPTACS
jgi:hypothetical protein